MNSGYRSQSEVSRVSACSCVSVYTPEPADISTTYPIWVLVRLRSAVPINEGRYMHRAVTNIRQLLAILTVYLSHFFSGS